MSHFYSIDSLKLKKGGDDPLRRFSLHFCDPFRISVQFAHVEGERHQAPFQINFLQSPQTEAPEPHHFFNDSEGGFHGYLSPSSLFTVLFGSKSFVVFVAFVLSSFSPALSLQRALFFIFLPGHWLCGPVAPLTRWDLRWSRPCWLDKYYHTRHQTHRYRGRLCLHLIRLQSTLFSTWWRSVGLGCYMGGVQ